MFRSKKVDAAVRTTFNQMNVVLQTFNATIRFVLHSRFGYDGNVLNINAFTYNNDESFSRDGNMDWDLWITNQRTCGHHCCSFFRAICS